MAENGGREKIEHRTTWSSKTSSECIKLNTENVL